MTRQKCDGFWKVTGFGRRVTSSNFGSTLGSQADQTVAKMKQFFGEDTSDGSMSGPLSNLLYRHSTGPVSVDASFWDHGFCGLSALPCKSVEMAHSKVNEADQTVDFVTDVKMTGTIVSKSSGSIIKSSSGKKMTADSTSQFVIGTGKMRLESLTLELPSVLSQALFVVSGGTLDVKSTVTLTNPTTTSHSNSLLSMSGGTVALDGTKLTTTQKLTLASSALIVQSKGSLTISNMKIENVSRTTGDGSVISATLSANTDKLSIVSTTFTLCSCSAGNGGALFVTLSASALFSITGTSSFTSCTASGKGSKLYLSRTSLVSFLTPNEGTGPLDSIKPPLSTKAAADAILNEFYGFESSSSEGSLPLYWYPFSSDDTTMHVHSSGHAHSLCGKEALPCQTLPDSLSKIQSASTLMIDSNIELSSKLLSLPRAWTLTKSGSTILSIISSGQLEISNSRSALTLSSLSLGVGTLTSERTTELMTVSGGSLVLSSCNVFSSTSNLPVSFVAVSGGIVSITSTTLTIPTIQSKPVISITGGELKTDSSTSFGNSDTATHQASILSIGGGEVVLDGTSLIASQSMTFASSPLIVQTKGSLTLKDIKIENITRQAGDGSMISATLSANTAIFSIESTNFASCSSSAGNGGALAVTITSGSFSLNKCRFESCSSGMDGGAVWLDLSKMPSPSQYSLLQTKFGTGSSANKASGKGDCVFVMGENLLRVIVGSLWRGSFETAGEDDLWGRDKSTSTSGMSLLGLLQSQVMGVGEGGSDEAAGTMDDPFETLRRCFVETEQSDGSFAVVVVERTRIGESCWLVDQPGWTMSVSGGGGGSGGSSQGEVLCRVSDEEKKAGTASSSPPHAMVTLSGQTLSFFDILFSSFSAPRSMGFVFSLLVSSHLTLSSCSLSSSSPVAVSLVSVSGSSSFSADNLSIRDVSFVGKAGLMKFVEASRIGLTSCSFSSISLEGGALMWGTTRGGMAVTNTDFLNCNGKEFGIGLEDAKLEAFKCDDPLPMDSDASEHLPSQPL
ncbi:hypothetical protein BLNAU_22264 [Blattamonas nauphoetae]|uniref:Ice nucleation protein n=1 Tax=Blattamonas nauphoetae TaxID=2049346 RepID=A0ABQ9WTJ1_9EUKA|nr:hypothetical protein BLNAU_22264 [Blattamonas nauphoetae]